MQTPFLTRRLICASVISMVATMPAVAADITLKINKVYEQGGEIRVAVFNSEENFRKKPIRALKQPGVKGEMSISIANLPAGRYGIMLFHDMNGNEKLDTNMLGIPKEYWSASLQGKTVIGRPGWSDVVFDLPEAGKTVVVDF